MAERRTVQTRRQNFNRRQEQSYVYGNVVTKPSYEPRQNEDDLHRRRRVSGQVTRNRKNALRMSKGYVMFLAFAAVLALAVCVNYVKLQSRITSKAKTIAVLQQELQSTKEENSTRYNAVMDSVNLEEVRDRAINDLGMVYVTTDQVVEYESPSGDFVKQYDKIPEDGVLAQSNKNVD